VAARPRFLFETISREYDDMTGKYLAMAGAVALLAACASSYDDARSPEVGTAGTLRNSALNLPPVGPVDSTSSVGTKGVYGTDVPPPSGPATVGSGSSMPPAAVPGTAIYYDAYGRAYAIDAYGRPYYVTAPGVLVRP
jgi:hypothetical protein